MELTFKAQEAKMRLNSEGWLTKHFESRKGGPFDVVKSKFVAMCYRGGEGFTETADSLEEAYSQLATKVAEKRIRGYSANDVICDDYASFDGDVK